MTYAVNNICVGVIVDLSEVVSQYLQDRKHHVYTILIHRHTGPLLVCTCALTTSTIHDYPSHYLKVDSMVSFP